MALKIYIVQSNKTTGRIQICGEFGLCLSDLFNSCVIFVTCFIEYLDIYNTHIFNFLTTTMHSSENMNMVEKRRIFTEIT